MVSGIYMIKNIITNQMYIGQSINIERRWREHCNLKDIKYSYLERAIKKYGDKNFTLSIIEKIDNISILNEREQYWIKYYNTYEDKNHYNLTPGGDFNPMLLPEVVNKLKGRILSDETKKKISEAHKGKTLSSEHRKKISKGNKNKIISQETRNKISQSKKGYHHTNKTKEKISKTKTGIKMTDSACLSNSKSKNTSGFYRVCKHKDKTCKQGFIWSYQYYDENNKRKAIQSVDIKKLEQKVKNQGLRWEKISV